MSASPASLGIFAAGSAATSPSGYLATRRLLASNQPISRWLQWLANCATVIGLLYVTTVVKSGEFADDYRLLAAVTVMLMAIVYQWLGVFSRQSTRGWLGLMRVALAWSVTCVLLIVLGFVAKTSEDFSRQVILTWFALALVAQCVIHILARGTLRLWHLRLNINTPSVVVGSGWLATQLTNRINGDAFIADQIVGVIDDPEYLRNWREEEVPVLSSLENLESVLATGIADRVYVALPAARSDEVAGLQERLLRHNIDVIWVPDIFAMNVLNPSIREIEGIPLIALSESPLTCGGRAYVKSLMDVCGAIAALIALGPLMLVAAAAVRMTSSGPALYRQARTGWDGTPFAIWKFRTMYVHDEGSDRLTQAHKDDARITRVGRFLRKTSIDELPQLFNVLAGSMSLVGPRPHSVIHNSEFCDQINAYLARHRVKPGMTGWAQVHGLRGEIRTIEDMTRRVEYDLEYINRWSLTRDVWILLRTPFALFSNNAY